MLNATFDRIAAKAGHDPAFLARLTSDPRAALGAEGVSLPSDLEITVRPVEPGRLVLAVPAAVSAEGQPSTEDPVAALLGRAASDPATRARLLADPRGTLAAAGAHVPAGVEIEVVEVAQGHLLLPLPVPASASADLDDAALGAVSCGVVAFGSSGHGPGGDPAQAMEVLYQSIFHANGAVFTISGPNGTGS